MTTIADLFAEDLGLMLIGPEPLTIDDTEPFDAACVRQMDPDFMDMPAERAGRRVLVHLENETLTYTVYQGY